VTAHVLIVDDDPAVGKVLGALLRQDGLQATHQLSARTALAALEARPYDLVISDLRMPEMSGMELLTEASHRSPEVPFIVLTAHGTVPSAVEAMKQGACDFLLKPFDREQLLFVVRKALQASARARAEAPSEPVAAGTMVGESEALGSVHDTIRRVAPSTSTVLIRGESGTGKELVARAIHERSPRRAQPFVKVHCAALPDNLLESELFGYERGAFTGAATRKPGRVELAAGGTLFLDEIGDITLAFQVKLLRVLQDREYERLGGTQTLSADVRFIAATHRDLESAIRAGQFREDLFYRLNIVPLWLPPLRQRGDDICSLAVHFCGKVAQANGKVGVRLGPGVLDLLASQSWPGNVRELQNFVERLTVLSDGPEITVSDVARELARRTRPALDPVAAASGNSPATCGLDPSLDDQRQHAEREAVLRALSRSGNNRTLAARLLGVSRRTLYNKLVRLGLNDPDPAG
jgi:two-component system response regulator AtoC